MELTRAYTVEQLEELGLPDKAQDRTWHSQQRWCSLWRTVFLDPADGTFWSVLVTEPATEMQECDWFDYYDRNSITCERVERRPVTRDMWVTATGETTLQATLPALRSTFDPAELRTAATGYAATLVNTLHEDTAARRAAGASPEDMALHLADAADLLDLIGKAFTTAAAEARASIEIDKDRSTCIDAVWWVDAPDGSKLKVGPDVKKTTTWNEDMLTAALTAHAFNELSAELLAEFAPIDVTRDERDRMKRAVEAGIRTVMGQGRHTWRVTDLARVRQALAHADAAEATLIDRAKVETSEVGESVKVTRIPAKPVKPQQ